VSQLPLCHNLAGYALRVASQAAWQSNIFWQNSEIASVVSLSRNDMATKYLGGNPDVVPFVPLCALRGIRSRRRWNIPYDTGASEALPLCHCEPPLRRRGNLISFGKILRLLRLFLSLAMTWRQSVLGGNPDIVPVYALVCPSGPIFLNIVSVYKYGLNPHRHFPFRRFQTHYPYPFINNKKADKTCKPLHGKFRFKNKKEGMT